MLLFCAGAFGIWHFRFLGGFRFHWAEISEKSLQPDKAFMCFIRKKKTSCFCVFKSTLVTFKHLLGFAEQEYLRAVYSLIKAAARPPKDAIPQGISNKGLSPTIDLIFQDGQIYWSQWKMSIFGMERRKSGTTYKNPTKENLISIWSIKEVSKIFIIGID